MNAINTPADARQYITAMAQRIGLGFHPDTRVGEYRDDQGQPLFGGDEAERIDAELDQCFDLLGDEVYDVGMSAFHHIVNDI